MNEKKYRWTLYLISAVMLVTLAIQSYWNYKNYEAGRQQLLNEVQTSLDNAVEAYYTNLAKRDVFTSWRTDSLDLIRHRGGDRHLYNIDTSDAISTAISFNSSPGRATILKANRSDSLRISIMDSLIPDTTNRLLMQFIDSLSNPIETLSSQIYISFTQDSISLFKVDSLIQNELIRKNLSIDYGLSITGHFLRNTTLRPEVISNSELSATANSPFLFSGSRMKIHYTNITLDILKRNIVGLLLSLILILGVLACLLYLLKVIRNQKQLAEVKNDLISNITHEFKTPLATIGVAMEGITDFNEKNDPDKNKRYSKIATEQVNKLNTMVEKLLETATLDSEKLQLNPEPINLVELLQGCTNFENFTYNPKTISFSASEEKIEHPVDVFHFENVINNILDNAIKYGGEEISVEIKKFERFIEILITDSGNRLTKEQSKQIFEKFYRVQQGNTHDVKGYGIGLYYAKKIIEKHNGSIDVNTNGKTTFRIILKDG